MARIVKRPTQPARESLGVHRRRTDWRRLREWERAERASRRRDTAIAVAMWVTTLAVSALCGVAIFALAVWIFDR